MNRCNAVLFVLMSTIVYAQQIDTAIIDSTSTNNQKHQVKADVQLSGQAASQAVTPFWFYANRLGQFDSETTVSGVANAQYNYRPKQDRGIETGASIAYKNGLDPKVFVDQLYTTFYFKKIELTAGVKHRPLLLDNLSAVGGDILWSRNARAIPGIDIATRRPITLSKGLAFRANFAHYELIDDRFVDRAKIHHKSLFFDVNIKDNQRLSFGLAHYVQWGGDSPSAGNQDLGLRDFVRMVLGASGGNTRNDQINALGNHLGSYRLDYTIDKEKYGLKLYHQSIFEDRSGRELNNFPDGVWGVFFTPKKNKFVNSVLYEYIQTISQSGRPRATAGGENQQSGGDNYFGNSIYRSGWSFFNQTIGLPFIPPRDGSGFIQNRSVVHHLGITGNLGALEYLIKGTYEKKLGSYATPLLPNEQAVYTFLNLSYPSKYGRFTALMGLDYSNFSKENIGFGLGYQYAILN